MKKKNNYYYVHMYSQLRCRVNSIEIHRPNPNGLCRDLELFLVLKLSGHL